MQPGTVTILLGVDLCAIQCILGTTAGAVQQLDEGDQPGAALVLQPAQSNLQTLPTPEVDAEPPDAMTR